jgi:hypothetical protein
MPAVGKRTGRYQVGNRMNIAFLYIIAYHRSVLTYCIKEVDGCKARPTFRVQVHRTLKAVTYPGSRDHLQEL